MNILLLGPQGSGKGTQARLLVEKFGFFYLSAGDLLREIAKTDQELATLLKSGTFIPDETTFGYVSKYLEDKGIFDNMIIDGFPRSVKQYNLIKEWLTRKGTKIDICINLTISEEETIKRLSSRRLDPATGKIYNLITDPPGPSVDQTKLVQRDDDKKEAIKKRLDWTKSLTGPLLELLKGEIEVFEIKGDRSIGEIQAELATIVGERIKK